MPEKERLGKLKNIIGGKDFEDIANGLLNVERVLITEFVDCAPAYLKSELFRVIKAGGKRIRPLLVLVCGKLGSFDLKKLAKAGACVEAVHTASLIHDDIIDNADYRRGKETTFKLYGADFAVKSGDYLFARSFEVLASLGNMEAISSLARAAEDLSLGELDGNLLRWSPDTDIDSYLSWISKKTASLFKASCEIGALISGAGDKEVEAVSGFGFFLGIAFQLFDDILDVIGSLETLGKPAGNDLKEGFLTLPYLLALTDKKFEPKIKKVVTGQATDDEVNSLVKELSSSIYLDEAKKIAAEFVEKAASSIEAVKNEEVKESLLSINRYVVQRYY